MKTHYEVIDTTTTNKPNDAIHTEIRLYESSGESNRVKVTITKNHYDYQSDVVVSAWSVTDGWLTITKHDLSNHSAGKAWTKFHEANETLFAKTAEVMFGIAEKFLTF